MFPVARPAPVDKAALALFGLTALLSVVGVKFGPGFAPYRSFTLVLTGAVLLAGDRRSFLVALRQTAPILLAIAAVAALGIVSSIIAHTSVLTIGRQLLEIHTQAAIGVVVVYALVLRVGVRPVLLVMIAIFALDGLVGLAQGLDIDAAWRLRAIIADIVHDGPVIVRAYLKRDRPLGLSFSPIHLSYHICLMLAALLMLRLSRGLEANRAVDPALIGGWVIVIIFAVATGNRSALLGLVAFLPLYIGLRAPRLLTVAIPLLLLGALLIHPLMQWLASEGLRVASTDDGSAEGRTTLRRYGLFLIGQRPIGYGLDFLSTRHWQDFFTYARYLPNPISIQSYAVHNYYLNMLLKYGVLILAIVPWILPRSRAHLLLWLGFLPYVIHIFYHNEGPLQGDYLVFFLLPVACRLAQRPDALVAAAKPRARPWRRAFTPVGA